MPISHNTKLLIHRSTCFFYFEHSSFYLCLRGLGLFPSLPSPAVLLGSLSRDIYTHTHNFTGTTSFVVFFSQPTRTDSIRSPSPQKCPAMSLQGVRPHPLAHHHAPLAIAPTPTAYTPQPRPTLTRPPAPAPVDDNAALPAVAPTLTRGAVRARRPRTTTTLTRAVLVRGHDRAPPHARPSPPSHASPRPSTHPTAPVKRKPRMS